MEIILSICDYMRKLNKEELIEWVKTQNQSDIVNVYFTSLLAKYKIKVNETNPNETSDYADFITEITNINDSLKHMIKKRCTNTISTANANMNTIISSNINTSNDYTNYTNYTNTTTTTSLCRFSDDIIGEIGKWLQTNESINFEMTCKSIFSAIRKSKIYYTLDPKQSHELMNYSIINRTRMVWNKFKYVDSFVLQMGYGQSVELKLVPIIKYLKHLSIDFTPSSFSNDLMHSFIHYFNCCKFERLESFWVYDIHRLAEINMKNMPNLKCVQIERVVVSNLLIFEAVNFPLTVEALILNSPRSTFWLYIPNARLCSRLRSLIIPNIDFNLCATRSILFNNLEEMTVQGCIINKNQPLNKLKRVHIISLLRSENTFYKNIKDIIDIPSLELFSADFEQQNPNTSLFIHKMTNLAEIVSKISRKHFEIYLWLGKIPPWSICDVIAAMTKNKKIEEFEIHLTYNQPKKYFYDITEPIYHKLTQQCQKDNLIVCSRQCDNMYRFSVKNHNKESSSANKWLYNGKFYNVTVDVRTKEILKIEKSYIL